MWGNSALLAGLILTVGARLQHPSYSSSSISANFNWTTITPSGSLEWHSCYDGFECARFEVPLDWSNKSCPYSIQLGVIRLPAVVSRSDDAFAGTIFTNPGGPGGSGVDWLLSHGKSIQEVADSPKARYEILSWDPRSFGATTPQLDCFQDPFQRSVYNYETFQRSDIDESSAQFNRLWSAFRSEGILCEGSTAGVFEDSTNVQRYTTTKLTVQDMIALLDALEKENTATESTHSGRRRIQQPMHSSIQALQKPALLNYWGFSYGSYLGNTFASMHPERVGRIILDGNVDAEDYTATGWTSNLQNFDDAIEWMFTACFDAGTHCSLYDSSTKDREDIKNKFVDVLLSLQRDPVSIVHNHQPAVYTMSDFRRTILYAAYSPVPGFKKLADLTQNLLVGNVSSLGSYVSRLEPRANESTAPYGYVAENGVSILCGDGEDFTHKDKSYFYDLLDLEVYQSSLAGQYWTTIPMRCAFHAQSLRPAQHHRFTGPFRTKAKDRHAHSSGILFLNSRADPVTPLRNAIANSHKHEGSSVLINEKPGHCTDLTHRDSCVVAAVRAFFANGALPANGTTCAWEQDPFASNVSYSAVWQERFLTS